MPYFSFIVATLLGLVWVAWGYLLIIKVSNSDRLSLNLLFWFAFAGIYAVLAVIAGWRYATSRARVFGWIHALQMLGVAGLCGVPGLYLVVSGCGVHRDYAGDQFRADLDCTFGLVGVSVAVITAVCGIGVIRCVLRKHTAEKPVAPQKAD